MREPNRLEMFSPLFRLLTAVFELFFPMRCAGCERTIDPPKKALCIYCEFNLPLTYFHLIDPSPLKQHLFTNLPVHRVFSLYVFEESAMVENLLYQLKYQGNKSVGIFFGQKLASLIVDAEITIDGIIGVPLHPKRKRARGYNQVDLIGINAASALKIPYFGHLLKRVKHTPKLSSVTGDRTAVLKNAFSINTKQFLPEGHYLLLDDILTTGATIKACTNLIIKMDHVSLSIATIVYRN